MVISAAQFDTGGTGQEVHHAPRIKAPLAMSSSTSGSVAQRTAWRSNDPEADTPVAYSAKTAGTTLNWDAGAKDTAIPSSDRGAKFLKGD